jgi:uncharacterized membrane protein (UPF0136 family)
MSTPTIPRVKKISVEEEIYTLEQTAKFCLGTGVLDLVVIGGLTVFFYWGHPSTPALIGVVLLGFVLGVVFSLLLKSRAKQLKLAK